jgi:hypothetical protein
MTCRVLLFILLVAASSLAAEAPFGSRGQVVPSGSISYAHVPGSDSTDVLNVAPSVLYFAADKLAIGLGVNIGYASVGGLGIATYGFSPQVAAVLSLAEKVVLFPQASLSFQWLSTNGSQQTGLPDSNSIVLGLFAPVTVIPVPHFFLGFGPFYNARAVGSGVSGATQYGVQSQIGGYF